MAHAIASLCENSQREVGVAIFVPSTLQLHLAQFIEAGRTYATTQLLLQARDVESCIVVAGVEKHRVFAASGGVACAARTLQLEVLPLPRAAFDDTRGLEAVQAVANKASRDSLSHAKVRQGLHHFPIPTKSHAAVAGLHHPACWHLLPTAAYLNCMPCRCMPRTTWRWVPQALCCSTWAQWKLEGWC